MLPRIWLDFLTSVFDRASVRVGSPTRTEHVVTAVTVAAIVAAAGYTRLVNETPLPALAIIVVASAGTVWARIRAPRAAVLVAAAVDLTYILAIALVLSAAGEPLYASQFGPAPIASIVTAGSLAYRAQQVVTWTLTSAAAVCVGTTTFVVTAPAYVGQAILFINMILFAAVPGSVATTRAERRLARQRERTDLEHRAATAERLRIARDLHDTLAHNLTLVNAQASVAEYLLGTDPDAAARALRQIAHHSAEALAEVRSTVGLLRYGDDPSDSDDGTDTPLAPTPSFALLDSLIRTHRDAGTSIEYSLSGDRDRSFPSLAGATAYRVVQEALTNAAKHAPGAPVTVALRWDDRALRIRVANPLTDVPARALAGSGQGLLGMEERVHALAGSLAIERTDERFVVEARLPLKPSGRVDA